MNMLVMTSQNRKPRLSLQVEEADREAISALLAHFPGATESFLVRAALRVGLGMIAKDKALVGSPTPKIAAPKRA